MNEPQQHDENVMERAEAADVVHEQDGDEQGHETNPFSLASQRGKVT